MCLRVCAWSQRTCKETDFALRSIMDHDDAFDEILGDLGFGEISGVGLGPGLVSCVDVAVTRLIRELHNENGDQLFDDAHIIAYEQTADALPLLLCMLRGLCSYETESGTVVPDHALVIFALYISHNHSFQESHVPECERTNSIPFAASVYMNTLLEESHSTNRKGGECMDANGLKCACEDYDANYFNQTVSLKDVSDKLCKLVYKRTKYHSPNMPTSEPVGISNVFGMISLFDCAIKTSGSTKKFDYNLGLRSNTCSQYRMRPGPNILHPSSLHIFDELSRRAVDVLQSRPLAFADFCKLLLFVLTDGETPCDFRRLCANIQTTVHTGTFILLSSWAALNYVSVSRQLETARVSYIDSVDYDISSYILLRHLVLPLMNPNPQTFRIKEDYKRLHGALAKWDLIEKFSSHHGQSVTLDTCSASDFKCLPNFNELRLNGDFGREDSFAQMRIQNTKFLRETLFALPTDELETPLMSSKNYFGIAAGDDDDGSIYSRLKDSVLGVRYRKDWLFRANYIITNIMMVCKLWRGILKPYVAHLSIAYFQEPSHFSDLAFEVHASTALRGMPALDTHRLERRAKSCVHAVRKYVFLDGNGELCHRMQSFPANLILGNSTYVKLRVAAEAGDGGDGGGASSTRGFSCVHAPALVASAFKSSIDPRRELHIRSAIDFKSALIKFGFQEHRSFGNAAENANNSLISGMFFVNEESMVAFDWCPTASSHSFRALNQKPLTPLRLLLYTGDTEAANDTMCASAPFYVMSRKSSQVDVDVAAAKRRKVEKRMTDIP